MNRTTSQSKKESWHSNVNGVYKEGYRYILLDSLNKEKISISIEAENGGHGQLYYMKLPGENLDVDGIKDFCDLLDIILQDYNMPRSVLKIHKKSLIESI